MILRYWILVLGLSFVAWSCGDVENDDATEEIPCTQVSGTWVVDSATCNGSSIDIPFATYTFESEELIIQLQGGSDCQRVYSTTATHTIPALATVGFGDFSCLVNGSTIPSCEGTDVSCDASTSADNRTNSFPICVLKNEVDLTLSRTASTEEVTTGVSFCTEVGQEEVLTLRQQQSGLAVLSISDGATYDFGPTPVGTPLYKTFTVTNSGDTSAQAVATTSLSTPFLYGGGAYPGVGGGDTGDCGTEILPGSCTLVIEFDPSETGSFEQTLSLSYNNGLEIIETSRAMTGIGQ